MLESAKLNTRTAKSADRQTEWAFLSSLRLENGIHKTTIKGRLAEVDRAMIEIWPAEVPMKEILDVGISSGTTSLEWLQALEEAGFFPKMTATDVMLTALLAKPFPGYQVLLSGGGKPLEHFLLNIPVRTWHRHLDYITQKWAIVWAANCLFRAATAYGAVAKASKTPISLVAPGLAENPSITLAEDDIFAPNPLSLIGRFDAIRAANLLIPGPFDKYMLIRGIAGLRDRLRGAGSVLIITRTFGTARSGPSAISGRNDASLFVLEENRRFRVRHRLNRGSEIEDLVLSL